MYLRYIDFVSNGNCTRCDHTLGGWFQAWKLVVYISTFVLTHTYTHTHASTHTHTYIYIYIYGYMVALKITCMPHNYWFVQPNCSRNSYIYTLTIFFTHLDAISVGIVSTVTGQLLIRKQCVTYNYWWRYKQMAKLHKHHMTLICYAHREDLHKQPLRFERGLSLVTLGCIWAPQGLPPMVYNKGNLQTHNS